VYALHYSYKLEFVETAMKFDINELKWTREPDDYKISTEKIEIITKPHTDLWQRTYYHFRNDNAPVLQMDTDEQFFYCENRV
jgi:regulation of enolase protein 1 (concanavalin A-like superfamily)